MNEAWSWRRHYKRYQNDLWNNVSKSQAKQILRDPVYGSSYGHKQIIHKGRKP